MKIIDSIMTKVKSFAYKLAYGPKATSGAYVEYLRSIGCRIGEHTTFYDPKTTHLDETRPWLVEIGDNVQITAGFTLLTHGADGMVLENKFGRVTGSSGKVKIGSNCFIGMNTTVLKGVTIGDNVVIGANSLVNKDIPDNCVAAGNPAKYIKSIDDHLESRIRHQKDEARELALTYYENCGSVPPEHIMREFFWLFAQRSEEGFKPYRSAFTDTGIVDKVYAEFMRSEPEYESYEDMMKDFGLIK